MIWSYFHNKMLYKIVLRSPWHWSEQHEPEGFLEPITGSDSSSGTMSCHVIKVIKVYKMKGPMGTLPEFLGETNLGLTDLKPESHRTLSSLERLTGDLLASKADGF